MKTLLFSIALGLPSLASAEPHQTVQEMLRTELKEIRDVRATLDQREREIAARLKQFEAGRDTTKGVSNICPAHKTEMRIVRAPIAYGLLAILPTDPPAVLRQREFPFARESWLHSHSAGNTFARRFRNLLGHSRLRGE